jgi:hypothetical protein
MSSEKIIYNGVSMAAEWPARIEAAQDFTTYIINGETYPRIRYGNETEDCDAEKTPCHDCCVSKGQFHVEFVCDMEECPRCGG